MPKQVIKIDQFHGGKNDSTDPRDFDENELRTCQEIDVSNLGRIVLIGDQETHSIITGGTATVPSPGYGLFFTRLDHPYLNLIAAPYYWETNIDAITGDALLINPTEDEYVLKLNVTATDNTVYGTVQVYSYKDNAWSATASPYGIKTYFGIPGYDPSLIFNVVAGNIRTVDANFNNIIDSHGGKAYKTSWVGFIHRNRYTGTWIDTDSTSDDTAAQFLIPGKCFRGWYETESHCYSPGSYVSKGPYDDASKRVLDTEISYGDESEIENEIIAKIGLTEPTNDILHLSVVSELTEEGGWRGFKKYYISLIYDGVQESFADPFHQNNNYDSTWQDSIKRFRVRFKPYHTWKQIQYNIDNGTPIDYYTPMNPRITGARVYFREVSGDASAQTPYGDKIMLFEIDFDKGIKRVESNDWIPWGPDGLFYGYGDYVIECPDSYGGPFVADMLKFKTEPVAPTFEAMSGIPSGESSINAVYKTSTIVNNRLYAANIAQIEARVGTAPDQRGGDLGVAGDTNWVGGKHRFDTHFNFKPDAMLKSPVNSYDVLPSLNTIEVTVGDGDVITCLENFADRILQFKNTKLHIINVSQDFEFLEGTYDSKGIWGPAAVCKTDFGIAWVNDLGCYFYDGNEVKNLLERQGKRLISADTWKTFVSPNLNPSIGFLPKERKLLVLDSVSDQEGEIYLYDFLTQSWVNSPNRLGIVGTGVDSLTNFIVDKDNDLMWQYSNSNTKIWNDSPANSAINFVTKDIDFGMPGVKKKIYKVYISYKDGVSNGTGGSGLQVKYLVNGDTPAGTKYSFNRHGTSSSDATPLLDANDVNEWTVAELKPAVSSEANDIYSIAIYFYASGNINSSFEINDISIVYRMKNIK